MVILLKTFSFDFLTFFCRLCLAAQKTFDKLLKFTKRDIKCSIVTDIELLENKAIRFVRNIKGRNSVSDSRSQRQSLQDHRKRHRLSLLMRVVSDNTKHQALASAYDELKNSRKPTTISTRAARRGEPTSIFASSQAYCISFLPCTAVRDLKLNAQSIN